MSNYEKLEKLQELKMNGSITEQEFEIEKNKILYKEYNEKKTKSIDIASFILGICAFIFGIIPVFGLVFSIVSLVVSLIGSKKLKEENRQSGLVMAGLIMSIVGLILGLTSFLIVMITVGIVLIQSATEAILL